ncbi:hypothetical protein [Winogradskyella aurantia]|uniref:Uncharacterized protein n=1 Tax=Winogradskyella aurantia TaxID=1915063 RepID=A0A265URW9_9FLAO|nr:hypothetical protein [Winogradskyella aurantia]OZV68059.1 hypothetical protein CA834_10455 [Winogradskyella aurantia]
MIKFFRKIRYDLMNRNKTAKYLKYAIGEIVLVVIGILIALQLNIQKEDAQEKIVTEELLIGIQADLKLEAERIDYLIAYYSTIMEGVQHIILFQQGKANYSNEELGQYFLNAFEYRKFSKFNTNYQTLYGSGLLQKIKDNSIPEAIISYYSRQFLEWSLEVYQQKAGSFNFNQSSTFVPLDKLRTSTNYQSIPNYRLELKNTFETDFKTFVKEPEVLNFLVGLLHQSALVFDNLSTYKASNLVLSKRIENYLNQ